MKNQIEYEEQWKQIAEKVAYTAFTGQAFDQLSSRGCTQDDIENFNVTVFASTYKGENNCEIVDLTIRFTVYIKCGNSIDEITFAFSNESIINALINQTHKIEYGVFQQYNFQFSKPNMLELYDGEYYLMQLLNLETL